MEQLLTTKLFIPPLRAELVPRARLINLLNNGIDRKLTLISAPAGFGKTTLVSNWVEYLRANSSKKNQIAHRIAWLSLDESDNDPSRFLSYVIAALDWNHEADTSLGKEANDILQSPQPQPLEDILISLINNIVDLPENIIFILDDYHNIKSPSINDAITFLLEHLPPRMHVVILSREIPHLPLARLRAHGQLNELRTADLRFTTAEVIEFFNQVMDIQLSDDALAALESRTEGWITGLQLAALALQGYEDTDDLIKSFSGSHQFVFEYLIEEILNQQPENVQSFLMRTAILNRLSSSLCDAVAEQENSQEILEMLVRANLFIIPLDSERRWYRYHHLFADMLRDRLQQYQAEMVETLHTRASMWFEENDLVSEAVNHALAAKDYFRAASLIEKNTVSMFPRGELHTLLNWIKSLPEELARTRPWLCVHQAWALTFAGEIESVEPLLDKAEHHISTSNSSKEDEVQHSERQEISGNIYAIRAYIAVITGKFSESIKLANLAAGLLTDKSLWALSQLHWAHGMAYRMRGELILAGQSFAEVVRIGKMMDNTWTIVRGLISVAIIHRERGQLHETTDLYREALQLATERDVRTLGYMGEVEAGLADVLYKQNNLEEAYRYAIASVEKTLGWKPSNHLVFANTVLARILMARGDFQRAWDALQKADQMEGDFPTLSVVTGKLEKTKVCLWLMQNNLGAIDHWARKNAIDENTNEKGSLPIAMARVLIAQGKLDKALNLLSTLEETAETENRINSLIEVILLQALAYQAQNKIPFSLHKLKRSLTLAEPGGYVRIFVDECSQLEELLIMMRSESDNSQMNKFIRILLAASSDNQFHLAHSKNQTLFEPLSEREIEVLQLIAEGLTNQEISSKLLLSLNTIKAHTHNIYGKLGVRNRTEAVAKARGLGILIPI